MLHRDQIICLTPQLVPIQGTVQHHVRRDDLAVNEWHDSGLVQPDDLWLEVRSHVATHVAHWLPVYLAQYRAVVMCVPGVSHQL